jgi:hypothetical protein
MRRDGIFSVVVFTVYCGWMYKEYVDHVGTIFENIENALRSNPTRIMSYAVQRTLLDVRV